MNELQSFFSSLNCFFDKIYVITLQRAKDRHGHIARELDGLHYSLFFGKDKQDFTIEELKRTRVYNEHISRLNHRYGKEMSSGQIGCSWSHAEVYKDVVQNGYQKVLILEDDVVIDKKAAQNIGPVLNSLPADWELFYLGFAEREKATLLAPIKKSFYHLMHSFGSLKLSHMAIDHLYPRKISGHIYEAGFHDCTHAYAVTHTAAKKLLALQQPISFIADNLLAYAVTNQIVKGYVVLPKIFNQQYQLGTSYASYLND